MTAFEMRRRRRSEGEVSVSRSIIGFVMFLVVQAVIIGQDSRPGESKGIVVHRKDPVVGTVISEVRKESSLIDRRDVEKGKLGSPYTLDNDTIVRATREILEVRDHKVQRFKLAYATYTGIDRSFGRGESEYTILWQGHSYEFGRLEGRWAVTAMDTKTDDDGAQNAVLYLERPFIDLAIGSSALLAFLDGREMIPDKEATLSNEAACELADCGADAKPKIKKSTIVLTDTSKVGDQRCAEFDYDIAISGTGSAWEETRELNGSIVVAIDSGRLMQVVKKGIIAGAATDKSGRQSRERLKVDLTWRYEEKPAPPAKK